MTDHYILQGREIVPCDMWTWAYWLESKDGRRIIGYWQFKSCRVSTVFMGLDHSFGSGPPILFETLIFGGPMDSEGERYSTYDEAEQGHLHYCEMVRDMERTMHWRKAKRWRNRHDAELRRFRDPKRRKRQLQLMKETTEKFAERKL
jgi:hypothetical protein